MKIAIWKQSLHDAMWLLVGCALAMFGFLWLYVYLTSFVTVSAFSEFVAKLPENTHGVFGISLAEAASWRGRVAMGYVDPVVVIISAVWAIARGSDAVSGPLDRGTMETVLAQGVSRMVWLSAHASVTILGAGVIAVAAWVGTSCGIATVSIEESVWFGLGRRIVPLASLLNPIDYAFSALNLFSLTVFTAALTTLVSVCTRYRRWTVGIVGSFYLLQIILKVTGLMAGHLKWLFYFTFLGAYWPQQLAVANDPNQPDRIWSLSLEYNGCLLAGATVCYVVSAIIFERRDLPAPL